MNSFANKTFVESRLDGAYLAAILQASSEAIMITSSDGISTSWNPAAERLFGYLAEEVLGRSISFLATPERLIEHYDMVARVNAGHAVSLETVWVAKGSRLTDISLTVTPVRKAAKDIIGIMFLATDITSRKRIEATLRETEAWASRAIEVARLGTWRWTPARDEVLADARCREICGFDPVTPLRLDMTLQLIHPDDRGRVATALTRAIQINGSGHYTEEYRFIHPDGSIHWVLSRGRTVFVREVVRDGALQGRRNVIEPQSSAYILGTILDVTEFMRVDQALRDSIAGVH